MQSLFECLNVGPYSLLRSDGGHLEVYEFTCLRVYKLMGKGWTLYFYSGLAIDVLIFFYTGLFRSWLFPHKPIYYIIYRLLEENSGPYYHGKKEPFPLHPTCKPVNAETRKLPFTIPVDIPISVCITCRGTVHGTCVLCSQQNLGPMGTDRLGITPILFHHYSHPLTGSKGKHLSRPRNPHFC